MNEVSSRNASSDLSATVLVVSHDPQQADVRKSVLENAGYRVSAARNMLEIRAACKEGQIKIAVVGYSLPLSERRRVWQEIREVCGTSTPILELQEGQGPTRADRTSIDGVLSHQGDEFIENVRALLRA
jgi:DNA-binding NtrC family response regulator